MCLLRFLFFRSSVQYFIAFISIMHYNKIDYMYVEKGPALSSGAFPYTLYIVLDRLFNAAAHQLRQLGRL